MTKKGFFLLLLPLFAKAETKDTLRLDLTDAIALAVEQSPSAKSARNTFLAAYWNYRYYCANYLPSVTLASSPSLNSTINQITRPDGTSAFVKQNQLNTNLQMKINQNIPWTGGSIFVTSNLNRLDELSNKATSYSSQPLSIGYQQDLFGYNSLKWERRIEPLRYQQACKDYAEAVELVSASTCSRFFSYVVAQTNLELARRNFASADTLYHIAEGRYLIGNINENEMLQLEINRLNEEANCLDAEVELEEEKQRIRSFLGLEQDVPLMLLPPDSIPHFQIPMEQATELALENSPDPVYYRILLLNGESSLENAKANSGLKADLYVQFGLSQTGDKLSTSYRNLLHQEYASVGLSLPILDWGRRKGRVRVAESNLELARTQVDQGMQDFRQNIQKAVMQFNMQDRKVALASKKMQQAQHRYEVAHRLYVMGRNTVLDLNTAISEKDASRRSYISALSTFWSLYYTIRSITGWDFEHNEAITMQDAELSSRK